MPDARLATRLAGCLASCLPWILPVLGLAAIAGCGAGECTEIGCESSLEVSYGVVVNEPYELTVDAGLGPTTVTCLPDQPDAEPPPDWLECDAAGFTITDEVAATSTTVRVSVVTLEDEEPIVANVLVPLMVVEILEPNGPDCEPTCVVRRGSVP